MGTESSAHFSSQAPPFCVLPPPAGPCLHVSLLNGSSCLLPCESGSPGLCRQARLPQPLIYPPAGTATPLLLLPPLSFVPSTPGQLGLPMERPPRATGRKEGEPGELETLIQGSVVAVIPGLSTGAQEWRTRTGSTSDPRLWHVCLPGLWPCLLVTYCLIHPCSSISAFTSSCTHPFLLETSLSQPKVWTHLFLNILCLQRAPDPWRRHYKKHLYSPQRK